MKKIIMVASVISLVLSGCYDKTETEDRRYVVLMGIDSGRNEEFITSKYDVVGNNGKYFLTVGEAKLENDIGKESEEQKTMISSGNTILEMKRTADRYSDKEIYFGQLKAAVLGKDLVSDGELLKETVYNIERMEDINTKVIVFAANSTAAKTVEDIMSKNSEGGLYLWDYYNNNDADADMKGYMDFENLVECLREEKTFIIPSVISDGEHIFISGGEVFKKGNYAGHITGEDIIGAKWFAEEAKGETVSDGTTTAVVKKEKNTDRVLEGGVFALYTKNDILNAEGEVILKADTMIEQKATDQDGRIVFTADLPINGSYYVKEVQAPAGFVTTEEIKEFDFAYAGEEVAEVSFEFTYEHEPTTFEITKSDITTGEELPGAKLKVSDSEGNVVDEWTSGSTPHIIKELEVGKKYTLTETIPADGYATAESITFVVENTADIQKVEMQDDTTKILISKVDMTDGSSEVKGAKLYILNENQEVMESWTSGDQPHYVEKLPIGTYTLLEETAPKGYIVANKVTFEIKDTGDIQGAKMEDEQAMGKVILNKTDKDTKKPMKGVEFALCDSKGKVLETLVTDSAGHAESKNYPIATFKNGQYKKAITYILKETKTLDGYQLDETEHKIQFEYVNDRTPVIEYTLDLTNKKAPEKDTPETSENQGVSTPGSHGSDATSVSNSPKTGDNTNIAIFVLALAVSAGCLGTVVTVKRKRK